LEPMSSPPPGFFARLVAKLRRYAARVRDSREELSQARPTAFEKLYRLRPTSTSPKPSQQQSTPNSAQPHLRGTRRSRRLTRSHWCLDGAALAAAKPHQHQHTQAEKEVREILRPRCSASQPDFVVRLARC
jgi:hypothetical protein